MDLLIVQLHLNWKKRKITNLKNTKSLLLIIVGLGIISLFIYFIFVRIPHEKRISNYSETINLVQQKNARLDDLLGQAISLKTDAEYEINEATKKELLLAISDGEKVEIKIPSTFEEANQTKKELKVSDYTKEINNLKNIIGKIKSKS